MSIPDRRRHVKSPGFVERDDLRVRSARGQREAASQQLLPGHNTSGVNITDIRFKERTAGIHIYMLFTCHNGSPRSHGSSARYLS